MHGKFSVSSAKGGGVVPMPSVKVSTAGKSSLSVSPGSRSRRTKNDASRLYDVRQKPETEIHVLDNGVDRTPLPLQRNTKTSNVAHDNLFGSSISAILPTDSSIMFHSSALNGSTDPANTALSTSMCSTSQTGLLNASSSLTSISPEQKPSNLSSESLFALHSALYSSGSAMKKQEECVPPTTTRIFSQEERLAWLEGKITVVLSETPTIMLYTHQDEIVSAERGEELRRVEERNAAYAALVEAKRGNEGTRFQQKGVWTFSVPKKSIYCSITPLRKKNAGALQVTPWMLRDQFAELFAEDPDVVNVNTQEKSEEDEELMETISDAEKDAISETTAEQSVLSTTKTAVSWMFAESLFSNLRIMERAVVQNTMEEVQLSYRGIMMDPLARRVPRPHSTKKRKNLEETNTAAVSEGQEQNDGTAPPVVASTVVKAEVPPLKMSDDIKALWTFRSPLTKNCLVTCMDWNHKECDILAVGYSAQRGSDADGMERVKRPSGGFVCFWSLKNPLAPERVIELNVEAGVSAVAFSYEHPSLLAVGTTDGDIVIYDIQKETNSPAITMTLTSGQHTGAVWEMKWVARGKERGEFLISISGDGRVVQWAVGKTIERVAPDLMTLKRQHGAVYESAFADVGGCNRRGGKTEQRRKNDALFSRQCGGMCIDVSPADNAIYIVGTEDGSVYQCSKSQTENYELSYTPHSELVYRVRWSPFSDYYFLTCSADWSSRLYRFGKQTPLLTFDSPNQNAVQDVAWSFVNSKYFVTVTAQGRVELWSVTDSIHPCSTALFLDQRRLTNVLFAEQTAPVVVVGDEKGDVTLFRLFDQSYGSMNMSAEEQECQLEEAIRKATC